MPTNALNIVLGMEIYEFNPKIPWSHDAWNRRYETTENWHTFAYRDSSGKSWENLTADSPFENTDVFSRSKNLPFLTI